MLIEALVAILLFTLGIVAVMGLQANSIAQVSQTKYRIDASYLANQIIGKMWVDQAVPADLAAYATAGSPGRAAWDNVVANTLPSGAATITVVGPVGSPGLGGNTVTVTITWKQPEDIVTRRYVAVANINPSTSPP
jgi:type IV pilus assembly protein PilV